MESQCTLSWRLGRSVPVETPSATRRAWRLPCQGEAVLLVALVHSVAEQLAQGLEIDLASGYSVWE